MSCFYSNTVMCFTLIIMAVHGIQTTFLTKKYIECGQYGFICEGSNKLRLCDEEKLYGPAFNCPSNTICNQESSDVCENSITYVDPSLSRTLRCQRYERVADPNVPGCKGYILCIPNNNRFQGIKFKCTGNTIFNGFTRTCSTPDRYKCPMYESQTSTPKLFNTNNDESNILQAHSINHASSSSQHNKPIDCKSYKFVVTEAKSPVRATYFCPPRPASGDTKVRCTIFSNQFCITLERDDPDQFAERVGVAYRKPRIKNP